MVIILLKRRTRAHVLIYQICHLFGVDFDFIVTGCLPMGREYDNGLWLDFGGYFYTQHI